MKFNGATRENLYRLEGKERREEKRERKGTEWKVRISFTSCFLVLERNFIYQDETAGRDEASYYLCWYNFIIQQRKPERLVQLFLSFATITPSNLNASPS